MGGNKRFEGHRVAVEDENSVARAKPLGLTRDEVDLDNAKVGYPKDGLLPVAAWVRYPEAVLQDAKACAWTDNAVLIEVEAAGGAQRIWVWASAVRRR